MKTGAATTARLLLLVLALAMLPGGGGEAGGWPWGWSRPIHVTDAERAISDVAVAPCPLTARTYFIAPRAGGSLAGGYVTEDGTVVDSGTVLDLRPGVQSSHVQLAPASERGFHLLWLERQAATYRLMYVMLDRDLAPVPAGPAEVVRVDSVLRDPFLAADGEGRAWVVWADMEHGRHSLVVAVFDGSGPPGDGVRLTGTDEADIMPSLAVDDAGGGHLTWLRQEGEMWSLMYRGLGPWPDLDPGTTLSLGTVSGRQLRPTPVVAAGGSVHVAWVGLAGGRAGRAGLTYTRIDVSSGRIQMAVAVSPSGSVPSDPSLSVPSPDRVRVAWVEASGARSVVHAAAVSLTDGAVSGAGPVVRVDADTVRPTLVAGEGGHVLLLLRTVTAGNLYRIHAVNDRHPADPDLPYWLGLSPTSPWGDLAFRLAAGLITAAVAATMRVFVLAGAIMAVMLVDRLAPDRGPALSRLLLMLALLFLLKDPGNPAYHAATIWTPAYEWASFALASTVALGLWRLSGLSPADVLGCVLAGFTFLAVDAFLGAAPGTTNLPYFIGYSPDAGTLGALRLQKGVVAILALGVRLRPDRPA